METEEITRAASWDQFGRRLRYWRRRCGLTQAQLGHRLGYHHSQISRLEAGRREAPAATAARADELLGSDGELFTLWTNITGGRLPLRPEDSH